VSTRTILNVHVHYALTFEATRDTFNNSGYMRTADPILSAYARLLQPIQTYRSTYTSFFRGITRSGTRAASHSQHCSGSLCVVSMFLRGYRRSKILASSQYGHAGSWRPHLIRPRPLPRGVMQNHLRLGTRLLIRCRCHHPHEDEPGSEDGRHGRYPECLPTHDGGLYALQRRRARPLNTRL